MDIALVQHFKFAPESSGFHVCKNAENWRPMKGH